MSASTELGADGPGPAFEILRPAEQTAPLVLCSPHSGRDYPPRFVAASRLDPITLRRSEDSFVDELFAAGPACGAPLLRALFPRAYVDANREPYELDPEMFADTLPPFVNTDSPRVRGGLGTLARVVANGEEIYRARLRFAEAEARIRTFYRPYHAALVRLIDETRERFGFALLLDCHSMPSVGGPMDRDPGAPRVDMVLGDRYGTSCHPRLTATVGQVLQALGYAVGRNAPYAGGFTTRHYGAPESGVHALQIEINRALYLDEERLQRGRRLAAVAADMTEVIEAMARFNPVMLAAE